MTHKKELYKEHSLPKQQELVKLNSHRESSSNIKQEIQKKKAEILQSIEEDKKKAVLLSIGKILYEEVNDPVFKKQIVTKNGYVGSTTKFILNFASYKVGSNLRYCATIVNILLTVILAIVAVHLHDGSFWQNSDNFMSFKVIPSIILVIQIAYSVFCIFEYQRIYQAQNKGKKCNFGLEIFNIYLNVVLWIVLIVYLFIGTKSVIKVLTTLTLFFSIMVEYTNVSCRNRGVSCPNFVEFFTGIQRISSNFLDKTDHIQDKNFIGSYDMCVIKLITMIYILFNNSRRDAISKYGTVIAVCLLLYFYHVIQLFTQFQAFITFKKTLTADSLLHPHRKKHL